MGNLLVATPEVFSGVLRSAQPSVRQTRAAWSGRTSSQDFQIMRQLKSKRRNKISQRCCTFTITNARALKRAKSRPCNTKSEKAVRSKDNCATDWGRHRLLTIPENLVRVFEVKETRTFLFAAIFDAVELCQRLPESIES